MQPGDIVNVPIGVYRGFRNAGDDLDNVLIAVVGGPDTGKVDWHPSVIDMARKTGLAVDDDGKSDRGQGRRGVGSDLDRGRLARIPTKDAGGTPAVPIRQAGAKSLSPDPVSAGSAGPFGVA